jgi:hypothetical protein
MYILELCHGKLALLGVRVHIFLLRRKQDFENVRSTTKPSTMVK